jgi:DNA-binding transcriptional regulator YhcF (GntR family)
VRSLAAEYRVNPLTVLKGYQQQARESTSALAARVGGA